MIRRYGPLVKGGSWQDLDNRQGNQVADGRNHAIVRFREPACKPPAKSRSAPAAPLLTVCNVAVCLGVTVAFSAPSRHGDRLPRRQVIYWQG